MNNCGVFFVCFIFYISKPIRPRTLNIEKTLNGLNDWSIFLILSLHCRNTLCEKELNRTTVLISGQWCWVILWYSHSLHIHILMSRVNPIKHIYVLIPIIYSHPFSLRLWDHLSNYPVKLSRCWVSYMFQTQDTTFQDFLDNGSFKIYLTPNIYILRSLSLWKHCDSILYGVVQYIIEYFNI